MKLLYFHLIICTILLSMLLACSGCALQEAPVYEDELLQDDNLLALVEVVEALQSEGLNLTRSRARSPVELSLTEIKPFAYSVDGHPFNLFIYVYQSAHDRSNAHYMWGDSMFSDGVMYYDYHAKNTVLLFGPVKIEQMSEEEISAGGKIIRTISKVYFEQLNEGERILLTGESPSWTARIFIDQYRHRFEAEGRGTYTESSNRMTSEIRYTGDDMEEIDRVHFSYRIGWEGGGGSSGRGDSKLDQHGYLNITRRGGSSYIEEDTPFSITLSWDDKEETLELKHEERLDDTDLLLLGNKLPFGSDYSVVRSHFPELGPYGAEGGLQSLAEAGLMEAVLQTEILGHQAKLEFNFQLDRLYSYYFFTTHADEDTATELYEYLQDFYIERYGPFAEEEQQEGEIYIVSSHWQTGAHKLALTYQKNWDGRYFVNWGWCTP